MTARMVPLLLFASVLASTPPLDPPVVARVLIAPGGGAAEATLLFTNPDPRRAVPAPRTLPATVTVAGRAAPVDLDIAASGDVATVPAGGYLRVRYRFALPAGAAGDAVLTLGESRFAFAATASLGLRQAQAERPLERPALTTPVQPELVEGHAPPPARNALLPNLQPYRPVYAVYEPSTDSAARLQLSLQYQLFGDVRRPTGDWKEGFRVAYTQAMFWDLGQRSKPFRDVNYMPEIFYRTDVARPVRGAAVSLTGGFLHISNGRGGDASRSFQTVYIEPAARFRLLGLDATVAPRLYQYVGRRDDNPDIARYRGHQSLALAIGRADGLWLSTETRYNFGSGKGAIEGELSYPMARLIGVPIYLVAQGFRGYGEDLRDYDRRQTRLRIGIGVVR